MRPAERNKPGKQPDGSVLLPNQWSLRPVGRQIELRDFPINIAVHPSGRYAAVLHSGYSTHQVSVVDLQTSEAMSHMTLDQSFYGIEFSGDGRRLFCSGAGMEVVYVMDFQKGHLGSPREIRLRLAQERGVPAGLAVDSAGQNLYVANLWADRVTRIELGTTPVVKDIPLRTNVAPIANLKEGPIQDEDTLAATKRVDAGLYSVGAEDTFPYACRLDEKKQRLYVSLWAQSAVAVIDLKSNTLVGRWPTQEHPCEMALTKSGKVLYVTNANRNTVTVIDTVTGKVKETIWTALYPQAPPGSTPNSLALSPDEKRLFVANADNNSVAVFDTSIAGQSRSLGFIPVGWYPTSVRVTPDGKKLLVANGKGVIPMANPLGPQPGVNKDTNSTVQYIARLFRGTLSVIDLPSRETFEGDLRNYTAQAYRLSPLRPDASVSTTRPANNPIPLRQGEPSPIKYCIYIVKENRTYDQVLGDMPEGNGDKNLCLFPQRITPNQHSLAREFLLLDNFYVESEVSADGHEWTMGAYATDFVEKMWPMGYGHNRPKKFPFPAEGNFDVAFPARGYIWDRAREAGVSYRSYGEFVTLFPAPTIPTQTRVKSLKGHVDGMYPGFDLDYPDVKRASRFISELKRFEGEGDMPRLQIIRLPNDHTHGVTPGKRTPKAYVADNDFALGQIVDAVSRSKFWPKTAIFIVEDDAQNGPDHVDAHRTIAFVASPFTRRKMVDSTMYSTSSMLRTMELILGLNPMSQFDAAATPMYNAFQQKPDLRPYDALRPNVDLEEKNPTHAWGGDIKMNFAKEDAADDLLLNEMIWRSVRGAHHPMPPPVRAAFVFGHSRDQDDD